MENPLDLGLPHREPFVFIDAVVEIQPGQSAVCSKRFSAREPFFRGHFPGDPIVPGVIITEALAQTAGIAAGTDRSKSYRLSAIKQMKFFKPARPEQQILLSAVKLGEIGGLIQFATKATAGGGVVAEGIIVLSES